MHAQCCTHVDQTRVISLPQVVKHGGLIQVGQTGHVLCLLKLWGVHLLRDIDIKHSLLKKTKYSQYMHVSYLCMHASLTLPLGNSTVTLSPLVLSTWAWANPCSASGTQSHFLESKAPPEPPLLGAARRYTSGSSLISSLCSCGLARRDWFDTHAQADSAVWLRLMRSASLTAATWTAGQQFPNSKSTFFFSALGCERRRGMWASEAALRKYFANLWP